MARTSGPAARGASARSRAAVKAAATRRQDKADLARLMAQSERAAKREATLERRAKEIGKVLGRGRPVSRAVAKAVQREWRQLSSNPRLVTWVSGFAEREAKRTGRFPTVQEVRRNPEFRRAVDIIFATTKRSSKRHDGPLAKALVTIGIRDPELKWDVGSYRIEGGRYVRPQ